MIVVLIDCDTSNRPARQCLPVPFVLKYDVGITETNSTGLSLPNVENNYPSAWNQRGQDISRGWGLQRADSLVFYSKGSSYSPCSKCGNFYANVLLHRIHTYLVPHSARQAQSSKQACDDRNSPRRSENEDHASFSRASTGCSRTEQGCVCDESRVDTSSDWERRTPGLPTPGGNQLLLGGNAAGENNVFRLGQQYVIQNGESAEES